VLRSETVVGCESGEAGLEARLPRGLVELACAGAYAGHVGTSWGSGQGPGKVAAFARANLCRCLKRTVSLYIRQGSLYTDAVDSADKLRRIADPVKRWERLNDTEEKLQMLRVELAAVRTEIVMELRRRPMSLQQIADALGISKTRAAQIESQRTA